MENHSFLGKGWSFPPEFEEKRRSVKIVEEELDIKESILILLANCLDSLILIL